MRRRALTLPALLVVAAIAVGACGGSTPTLSDPGEILTKAVETLQNAKSFHLEATLDGTATLISREPASRASWPSPELRRGVTSTSPTATPASISPSRPCSA